MGLKEELKQANETLRKIELIMTGNGHPEQGLIYRVNKNTDFRMFWERFGWLILGAVFSAPTFIALIVHFGGKGG